ncbi:GTP-binding protein [Streptomyces sp. MUM 178J]|uniref:GTP-binding protein n=1 Tax=Streptomyces sp. MUM 178J TaxID=2791991 RepID=UPI001F03DF9B|nr:ATP/GTP-binding protein [Streptomyces sp. MUM 178J]WRQ79743.1 ATP/GTP-binding protein [Streptomyces sp. MUM 178J]
MASKAVSDAEAPGMAGAPGAPGGPRSPEPPGSRLPHGAEGAGTGGKYVAPTVAGAAKILVVGPLGVGKTTLIGTVSEIEPLSTEAVMTQAGARVDTGGERTKRTTTVALDFGRMTLGDELVLYLFGTPGQQRFLPAWRDLAKGALGALALIDTRDLAASFDALGNLEDLGLPFAIAANVFPGSPRYPEDELRLALDLLPDTPLVACDAREHRSSVEALIALVRHLIDTATVTTQSSEQPR